MDFSYFLRLVLDRKWLIILATVLAAGTTYFITKESSVVYKSEARLSTGITQSNSAAGNVEQAGGVRPWEAQQQFSNLIEIMNSRTVIGLLSRKLILHDLTDNDPFRDLAELKATFSPSDIQEAQNLFESRSATEKDAFSLANDSLAENPYSSFDLQETEEEAMMKEMLAMLGYDYKSLRSDLRVYRVGETDLLKMEFFSENKYLSAYVVNTLSEEFISYYSRTQAERSDNSVDFFTKLAFDKKKELDRLNGDLKQYKLDRQIINIEDQSTSRIAQIHELELRREQENKKIPSSRQAINAIDRELGEIEKSAATLQANNQKVQAVRDEISTLTNQAVSATAQGLDDAPYQSQIDEKRRELNGLITDIASNDGTLSASEQDLISQRLSLEIEMEIAQVSVRSIDGELGRLRGKVVNFVTDDAEIQAMEREIQVAQEEYLGVVEKLNTAKYMSLSSSSQLALREPGQVADKAEPSKTLFLSAFAGMLAFAFCVMVIFALAYLDMSLKTPDRFERMTDMPLIGYLNRLKFANLDLEIFFNHRSQDAELETFKQLLRKIRYQLEQKNVKRLLVTSTKENEGKSFLIISLAYSLSLNNKKVLIIDTNFKNNTLTQMLSRMQDENLLSNTKLIGDANLEDEFTTSRPISRTTHSGIDIIGSKGGYNSPSEIFAGKNFNKLLDQLELTYDYIFLEGSSMNNYSDTQELVEYSDHVIAVFSADSELQEQDKQSLAFLRELEDKLLGGVLNRVELKYTA